MKFGDWVVGVVFSLAVAWLLLTAAECFVGLFDRDEPEGDE